MDLNQSEIIIDQVGQKQENRQGEWGAGPMRISPIPPLLSLTYKMLYETAIYASESFSKNFWKYLQIWQWKVESQI